jgi:hypothetical protein
MSTIRRSFCFTDSDRQLFLHRVSSFFSRYVANIHLEKLDVSDLFQAVHFLTLEASAFLQVPNTAGNVIFFLCCKRCVLLSNDINLG